MHDVRQTLRLTLRNPFLQNRVDTAWDARPVASDVRAINDEAFQKVLSTINDVRISRQSHGLLLSGQPGSGKTHLLNRVRRWVQQDEHAWFVYILPFTAPDRVYRDILQATAGDITRSAPETHGINQLAVAVARLFMSDVNAPIREIADWWRRVMDEHPAGDALANFLLRHLDIFVLPLNLDSSVVRVVAQFLAGRNRAAARDWLLGRSLPDETLETLGVAFNLEEESTALTALTTLIRLGSDFSTVVFAFDQIEGLQIDPDDRSGLLAYGHAATQLLALHENVAIITCAQVDFVGTLEQIVGLALFQRVAERQQKLKLLSPAEAMTLVQRRLRTDADIEQVRVFEKASGADPVWPLTRSQIDLLSIPSVSARRLLMGCRELFDAWQIRVETSSSTTDPSAPGVSELLVSAPAEASPPLATSLDDIWETSLDEERERPDFIDDGVIIDGLLRAADGNRVKAERATKIRDVDVVINRDGKSIAVAVCNAENMTSLAARLKRLGQLHAQKQFDEVVIVRDQRLPIKAGAKATQQRLRELADGGARVVRLSAEAYAALAALRRLLADAAAGDLTLDGRPVQPEELKTWLAQNTPDAVVEAVRAVAGDTEDTPSQQAIASRVQELLVGRWIVPFDAIATDAKLSLDDLRDVAARESAMFGVIRGDAAGTQDLLFLRSSAIERA
ncbi:MAG TPA: ATP-binding protein [Thermoanaerobaculia bacterium]|nr:ATP-binding protein [Thermoanaerobaculia bacterium]